MELYFAGSFSPPTFGHAHLLFKAIYPYKFTKINIICSGGNPEKDNLFSEKESKEMWETYITAWERNSDVRTSVFTYEQFKKEYSRFPNMTEDAIMLRGIRNTDDLGDTFPILFNHQEYNIDSFLFMYCDPPYENISSSKARKHLLEYDLSRLSGCVPNFVIRRMFENKFGYTPIIVTGPPASGKSTVIEALLKHRDDVYYINTDLYNKKLRKYLPDDWTAADIVKKCIYDPEEILIKQESRWVWLLEKDLQKVPKTSKYVFVEIPQALREGYNTVKYLSDLVVNFDTEKRDVLKKRVSNRNKESMYLYPFIDTYPTKQKIELSNHVLDVQHVDCLASIENNMLLLSYYLDNLGK